MLHKTFRASLCAGLIAAALAIPAVQAADLASMNIPEKAEVASQSLLLNGAGIRTKIVFDVYAAALYTVAKTSDAAAVINAATPRRVELRMMREVSASKMHESFVEGLTANVPDADKRFGSQLESLEKLFKEVKSVAKGDVITLDFVPGQGTKVSIRGKAFPVITGDDFASALLSIWLGKKPVQGDLKAALLGSK
ncbi:chalcone isomerase family protein [Andreprevotia chitinilytica]|uniref:chalcone isomerase family protein n=1 Tax=Andreprevotia chitinilytica TaxID=396808 RepID=UPI000558D7BA|nr:chalcone isomerase family protein [Andreprevotia chitinilytica]